MAPEPVAARAATADGIRVDEVSASGPGIAVGVNLGQIVQQAAGVQAAADTTFNWARRGNRASAWLYLFAVSFAVLAALGVVLRGLGRVEAAEIVGVAALAPLLASALAAVMVQRSRMGTSPEQLDSAADNLSEVVFEEWYEEALTRGLLDPPVPLAVRWRAASEELTDHRVNVGRDSLSGTSADTGQLASMFSGLPRGRLVILGSPGSGKTSLAVLLLLALIKDRAPGDRVPVLLSAASWDPAKDHMNTWLVRELERIYGAPQRRGVSMVRQLLDKGKLLPIVDGLDELHEVRRHEAIPNMSKALGLDAPVILTCRHKEYEEAVRASDVLTSAAVILAEPIDPNEVVDYLTRANPPYRIAAWQPIFDQLRAPEGEVVSEVFTTALNVVLARSVYSTPDSVPTEMMDAARFPTADDVQSHLLDELVRIAYPRSPVPVKETDRRTARPRFWKPLRAPVWLGFLASHLERLKTPDLAWWRLRDALPPVGIAIAFGVFGGLIFGVAGEVRYGHGFAFGLGGAVATGLAASFRKTPEPRYLDLHGFGYIRSGLRLVGRASCVVLSCVLAGGEILGVLCGIVGGLMVGVLQFSWVPVKADHARGPADLLHAHRTIFVRNLLGGAAGGLVVGVVVSVAIGSVDRLLSGAITGVLGGLAVGMAAANAWIGYRVSHLWLAVQGRIPWRLVRFLDDSYDRGLLRQVGAAYQFRHVRLQERLAKVRSPR
ncbi:NACHT domain-containing protein [Candidatus Protofrankia californiensis]|uniref:NACHT domain-containing protein n=1 Tax=Candidatus Protofrankia californiensis TaxID=1839754 RepID=UPI001041AF1B|nr:NACHT domain-containing protein [Candidatus Protofrankia californiensis]